MNVDDDDAGIKLVRRLQKASEHGWTDTFNHLPASWAQVACWRIAALTGGAEVEFIDGRPWSKYDSPDTTGHIVAFTDTLMIRAVITGEARNYRESGVTVQAVGRSDLRSVSIPETSYFDAAPGTEWPDAGHVVAQYGSAEVVLPAGDRPSKPHLAALAAFMPSLLEDLPKK